jgi:hypothetical protein
MEQQIKLTPKEIKQDLRKFNSQWNTLVCDVQRIREEKK